MKNDIQVTSSPKFLDRLQKGRGQKRNSVSVKGYDLANRGRCTLVLTSLGGSRRSSSLQVNLLMDFEVSLHREALPTQSTAERLLAGVEAFVSDTVVLPRKHLTANFTTEWSLSRVHTLVRFQPGFLGKHLPTLEAPEGLGDLVHCSVLLQLRHTRKALVAHRTGEEFLVHFTCRHHPLHSQVVHAVCSDCGRSVGLG